MTHAAAGTGTRLREGLIVVTETTVQHTPARGPS